MCDHRRIENQIHYAGDVLAGEDACHVRSGSVPQVMAASRNCVAGLLRQAGTANLAVRLTARPDSSPPPWHFPLRLIETPWHYSLFVPRRHLPKGVAGEADAILTYRLAVSLGHWLEGFRERTRDGSCVKGP